MKIHYWGGGNKFLFTFPQKSRNIPVVGFVLVFGWFWFVFVFVFFYLFFCALSVFKKNVLGYNAFY